MNIRRIGAAATGALLALSITIPGASAQATTTTERYAGSASGQALDISILGRHVTGGISSAAADVDQIKGAVTGQSAGVGLLLAPETAIGAALGDTVRQGCTQRPIADLVSQLTQGNVSAQVDLACGEAGTDRNAGANDFAFHGDGTVGTISVNAGKLLGPIVDSVKQKITDPVLNSPLSAVIQPADQGVQSALGALNTGLATVFGPAGASAVLPVVSPTQTLNDVLTSLKNGDLVKVTLGHSRSENVGTATTYTARASSQGGVVEVLPNFGGTGKALLRITVGASAAQVVYARSNAQPTASADQTLVKVESPLIPQVGLPLDQLPKALAGSPLADLANLGYRSQVGSVQIGPGESVSFFCAGDSLGNAVAGTPLAALCTTITVGTASVAGDRADSAAVDIHVAKGLGDPLGTVLNQLPLDELSKNANTALGGVDGVLKEAQAKGLPVAPTGLVFGAGKADGTPGVKITFAGSHAQARGTKVLSEVVNDASRSIGGGSLPRTGFQTAPLELLGLLGAGAGLWTFTRRRRIASSGNAS